MRALSTGLHTDLADITAMMPSSSEETPRKESSPETISERDIVSISDEARNALEKLTTARASQSQSDPEADAAIERAAKILAENKPTPIPKGEGVLNVPVTDAQKQIRNAAFVGFLKDYSSLYTENELDAYNQRIQAVNGDARTASPDLFSDEEVADGIQRFKEFQKGRVEEYFQHTQTSFSGVTERGTKFTLQLEMTEDHLGFGPYTMTFTRTDGTTESFSFTENRGFRELEDGTIVQFGTKEVQARYGGIDRVLEGSEGQDILVSLDAHTVEGKGGNDFIFAVGRPISMGHGDESSIRSNVYGKINGGDGDDTIYIAGDDRGYSSVGVYGGNGNDTITFRAGSLLEDAGIHGEGIIDGGDGDDTISIEGNILYSAVVRGGAGNDKISVTSSGDILVGGKIEGDDGDDTISVTGKNITLWNARGGNGDDTITLKAEGTVDFKNIYGGSGNDSISIEGETVEVSLGGFLDGGEGDDSIKLKANKIITKYLRIDGGKGFDKIQLDAKIIEMMDSYIHGGGGGDVVSMNASEVTLKRTDVSGTGADGGVLINTDQISILGGHFDTNTSVSAKKASIKYASIFGKTFRDYD